MTGHVVAVVLLAGFGGLLAVMAFRAWRGVFTPRYYTPIEISGLYWHFVDLVWIFLFPLYYLIARHLH